MTSVATVDRGIVLARRIVRGRAETPAWERPALIGILALSAALYLGDLSVNGWANTFYSAAAQAGSVDWTAFLYGSSDAANSITVDKPPASLWFMALSARAFGLSPFSILLPEALMGVATVGVLYATVRRSFSAGTALFAAGILAVTPVATLMFRYDNPDALLVLLLTVATYFTVRGVQSGRLRWMIWAGVAVGFGFLTKQLEAFLVLPALAGAYLWAAPRRLLIRLGHLLAALGALVVSAGWWVALVELVPPSARPYVGGSQTNSFLEVTFGYNGLGRLNGDEFGTGSLSSGFPVIDRLLLGDSGVLIGWLLPSAIALTVVSVVVLRAAPRTSAQRATVVALGGSLVIMAATFTSMAGIFHSYYTLALAPALAGSAAIGSSILWRLRGRLLARLMLMLLTAATGGWAFALLSRTPEPGPWLRWAVLAGCAVGVILLALPSLSRALRTTAVTLAIASVLAGPLLSSLQSIPLAHSGAGVAASATTRSLGVTSQAIAALSRDSSSFTWVAAVQGSTQAAPYQLATGLPVMAIGGFRMDPSPTLAQFQKDVSLGKIHWYIAASTGLGIPGTIANWVASNFALQHIGQIPVYDLSQTPQPQSAAPSAFVQPPAAQRQASRLAQVLGAMAAPSAAPRLAGPTAPVG